MLYIIILILTLVVISKRDDEYQGFKSKRPFKGL
jgi:hypothetical protein